MRKKILDWYKKQNKKKMYTGMKNPETNILQRSILKKDKMK